MPTLQDIIGKVRRLTARDSTQLSDQDITTYVNTYYLYGLPADLQILKLEDVYTFNTQPNVDVYDFDSQNYTYVESPVRVGGIQANFFTNSQQFFAVRPRFSYIQEIATGDGTPGPYTGVVTSIPFHRSYNTANNSPNDPNASTFPYTYPVGVQNEVLVFANISNSYNLNCTDTPTLISGSGLTARFADTGTFIGDVSTSSAGSINYFTGDVSITFSENVPAGNAISASVYVYSASRPLYVLFFQNQIMLSPVPDQSYIIELKSYRSPAALMGTNSPELNELWELLAVGASLKVFEDNGDMGSYQSILPLLEKYESLVRTRGLIQRTRTRVPTIYSNWGQQIADTSPFFYGN